ncbi:MAG: carbohydrate binding family 9 domain-containing protein [Flavobacteriaceae bacterium]|nr:carbohydrate binding family 9 domain-containing protein [Flavobacteriaceae bacterium]
MQGQETIARATTANILIDGLEDEEWNSVEPSSSFWQYFPSDSIQAPQQTRVKFLFDAQNLYVLIIAEADYTNFITPSLRRDFSSRTSDSVTLVLDTFNDGTNAFLFGTNPEGVQREALISNGGTNFPQDFNISWDVKWEVAVQKFDGGYRTEMKIPFSSLRYAENNTDWQVNVYRSEIGQNRTSTWAKIPRNQSIAGLAYMNTLSFEKELPKAKAPIALIPFSSGIVSKDFEENTSDSNLSFGGDAKLSIGNGMILDLTLNPDFSQVEVDDQIINLTRFEVRLPEKRQFFIQNSDLFDNYGDRFETQPFFSRRIGVAKDLDGNTIENKIIAGARLSGKITNNMRLGFLNMQTQEDRANGISANNNTVFSLQQKMFSRSYLGLIFVNRQQTGDELEGNEQDKFNRVLGLDYTLASKDNKWTGRSFIHQSFLPNKTTDAYSAGFRLNYNVRKHIIRYGINRIGDGYQSDLGFLRRTGIQKHFLRYGHRLWVDSPTIRSIQLSQSLFYIDKPKSNNLVTDRALSSRAEINFTDQSRFQLEYNRRYTFLTDEFNPLGIDDAIVLPGEMGYNYSDVEASYRSNFSKKINYNFQTSFGDFYNGTKFSVSSEIAIRLQPRFNGSIKVNYDKIDFPAPYTSGELWLIGPKLDYTFSKSIFWNTFIQYSSQSETLGINSRLQWRFAPLSDFYIVYNDNYFATTTFVPRVRSLTFKLTYWLNL